MRPGLWVAAAAVSGAAAVAPVGTWAQFRVEANALAVPVLVKSGGRPVADLTIGDFALTDNGVTQTVAALHGVDAPLDVSIVVQQTRYGKSSDRMTFGAEIEDVRRQLRATDQLEVVSASDGGRTLLALGPPIPTGAPPNEVKYPCVTLYDAITRVMMRPPVYGRHQLLLIFTEREGGGGSVTAETAMAVARRSQVSVSVLMIAPPSVGDGKPWNTWGNYPHCAMAVLAWLPATRSTLQGISRTPDVDHQDRALSNEQRARLDRLAEVTGGQRLHPGMFGGSVTAAVRSVLDEARQRYILYFTPAKVPSPGWHTIQVSVRRSGSFEISSRPGYER